MKDKDALIIVVLVLTIMIIGFSSIMYNAIQIHNNGIEMIEIQKEILQLQLEMIS